MPVKTLGSRSLKGLKVLHSRIPFLICFQNKRESFLPYPTLPQVFSCEQEASRARARSKLCHLSPAPSPHPAVYGPRAPSEAEGWKAGKAAPVGLGLELQAPEDTCAGWCPPPSPLHLPLTPVGYGPNKGWEFLTFPPPSPFSLVFSQAGSG